MRKNNQKVNWILVAIVALVIGLVFRKYFFRGLVPIPADIITGLYYPWFDYKWGYATPVPVKNPLPSDVVSILYPWRILGIDMLKSGSIPLWDPTILLGVPLLANPQSALTNPLNVLFWFFGSHTAWSIQVILQPVLMITGMYFFLRELALDKPSSVFGGLLYAFSGYAIVWLEYNSIGYTLAFFPIILLSVLKLSKRPSAKWIFTTNIFVFLQLLSGYPLNAVFSLLAAAAFYGFLTFTARTRKAVFTKVLYFTAAIAGGIGLAAIQLVPTLELYGLSIRKYDAVGLAANVKYLPVSHLVTLFAPDFFGNPATGNYYSVGTYDNFAFSVSAVGVFFVIVFLLSPHKFRKIRAFFLGLLVASFLFVLQSPVTQFLAGKNYLALTASVNTRALFLITFCMTVFAACGFTVFRREKLALWKKLFPTLTYTGILGFLILFFNLLARAFSLNGVDLLAHPATIGLPDLANLAVGIKNFLIPCALVIMTTLFTTVFPRKVATVGVFVLLVFGTVWSTDKYLSFSRVGDLYPTTEVSLWLKNHASGSRILSEKGDLVFPSNTWAPLGILSASGQDVLAPLTTARYYSQINYTEVNDDLISRYLKPTNLQSPLISTLNSQYYLAMNWDNVDSPSPEGSPHGWLIPESFEEAVNIKTVRIFDNTTNLGPAWFAHSVSCISDDGAVSQQLARQDYDPGRNVFVDCAESDLTNLSGGQVELVDEKPGARVFKTVSKDANYLVVSQAYFPGWKATIDGLDALEPSKANIGLTAVKVPSGEHLVELYYDPKSFKYGLFISLAVVLVWGTYFAKTYVFTGKNGVKLEKRKII